MGTEIKDIILFTYYDGFNVKQTEYGFTVCVNNRSTGRSFEQLSSAVIYCMAITNRVTSGKADAIADLFTTYINCKNS